MRLAPSLALLALLAPAQSGQPTVWDLAELAKKLDSKSSIPITSTPGLDASISRVKAGASLSATSHPHDAIYQVVAGTGVLTVGSKKHPLTAGKMVLVPARASRSVEDVTADLTLLVIATKSVPHTGGMAVGPRPTKQIPFPETSPRGSTRIFYWFGPGSAGQLEIGYGLPAWKPAYERFMTQPTGRRWRFGQNFWSRLDTNIDLTLAGVKVPRGYYYLTLEHDAKKGLMLVALKPSDCHAGLLDAWHAPKTKATQPGIEIPMKHSRSKAPADQLHIELTVDRSKEDAGALTIRFGPHVLTADLVMHAKK